MLRIHQNKQESRIPGTWEVKGGGSQVQGQPDNVARLWK